jgi:hypothetical protein
LRNTVIDQYLITDEPGVFVGLMDDVADFAVGVDAPNHTLLAVNGVRQFFLLKNNQAKLNFMVHNYF